MMMIVVALSAVACGWFVLLVISDERQRSLDAAQLTTQSAAQPPIPSGASPAGLKTAGSEKRKN